MRTVRIIGDSHTLFCFTPPSHASEIVGSRTAVPTTEICSSPGAYEQQITYHLGPITMSRAGWDIGVFEDITPEAALGDAMVYVFGEIDVRCHIVRLAKDPVGVEKLCGLLAVEYVARLAEIHDKIVESAIASPGPRSGPTMVFGVIPPFDPPGYALEAFPIVGTLPERVRAARSLNAALARNAAAAGLIYFDVYDEFSGPDGSLPLEDSDSFCHIGHHRKGIPAGKLYALLTSEVGRQGKKG